MMFLVEVGSHLSIENTTLSIHTLWQRIMLDGVSNVLMVIVVRAAGRVILGWRAWEVLISDATPF